jgi:hypothetical protein
MARYEAAAPAGPWRMSRHLTAEQKLVRGANAASAQSSVLQNAMRTAEARAGTGSDDGDRRPPDRLQRPLSRSSSRPTSKGCLPSVVRVGSS